MYSGSKVTAGIHNLISVLGSGRLPILIVFSTHDDYSTRVLLRVAEMFGESGRLKTTDKDFELVFGLLRQTDLY